MAEAFLGLTVALTLNSGISLDGIVSHIDQHTQQLTLKDAQVYKIPGFPPQQYATYGVPGTDIKHLQILSKRPAPAPAPVPAPAPAPVPAPAIFAPILQQVPNHLLQHHVNHLNHLQQQHQQAPVSRAFSPPQLLQAQPAGKLPYVDPAIVSFSHPSASVGQKPGHQVGQAQELTKLCTQYPQSTHQYHPLLVPTVSITSPTTPTHHHHQPPHQKSEDEPDTIVLDYDQIIELSTPPFPPVKGAIKTGSHVDHAAESSAAESASERVPRRKGKRDQYQPHANADTLNSPSCSPRTPETGRRTGANRRQRQPQHVHAWAGEDVNDFKEEEFDFQANLNMFDKEKVFAEIRELDATAPETLLVNLNRAPPKSSSSRLPPFIPPPRINLAPHENVLDPSPRPYAETSEGELAEEEEEEEEEEKESDDSWTSAGLESGKESKKRSGKKGKRRERDVSKAAAAKVVRIRTVTGAVACPSVTPVQMVEVEKICAVETGPNEDQMIENAGRSASMMALQAIGGPRRIQPNNHNAAPFVVVLVGNNKTGAYGLCAARHLANHGCQVVVCVAAAKENMIKSVAAQLRIFGPTGGRTVEGVEDLPQQYTNPVDLIIDALLGYQFTLRDLTDDGENPRRLVSDLMDWANANKAPVLSLDFPSGVNGATGAPSHQHHYIHPKWTLCLGAPKTGCRSRATTGELFLADIGVPRQCWRRVGVKGWGIPWGSEFLVGLEYV